MNKLRILFLIGAVIAILCPILHAAIFGYAYSELAADIVRFGCIAALCFTVAHLLKRTELLEDRVEELERRISQINTQSEE